MDSDMSYILRHFLIAANVDKHIIIIASVIVCVIRHDNEIYLRATR